MWYVRTRDGQYLVDVASTIRPLDVESGIGQLTIEREWSEFETEEKAEKACRETGRPDAFVTDVPPPALRSEQLDEPDTASLRDFDGLMEPDIDTPFDGFP